MVPEAILEKLEPMSLDSYTCFKSTIASFEAKPLDENRTKLCF